jgi:deoxyribodipyrimidine photo-lyase
MSATPAVLVWFRHDLRVQDNAAVLAAARSGKPVFACFVRDDSPRWAPGGASRWWLHGSVAALGRDVERRGGAMLLRSGASATTVARLAAELDAVEVHCAKSYEPDGRAQEKALETALAVQGSKLVVHAGDLLFDPEVLRNQSGEPFKVFTPFWNACLKAPPIPEPHPVPSTLRFARPAVSTESLDSWGWLPGKPDWAGGMRDAWTQGEAAARARLDEFLAAAVDGYKTQRDRPDLPSTSRLSPYLHFGEISPRVVWHAVRAVGGDGAMAYARELGWREFARHLLWHWPTFPEESFRPEFRRFPWRDDAEALARWQRGLTGYPLVDAGMRELWHTGWMHNRVRMVVASFLVKHLLVPWQRGAAWFWDTLVDADLANNSAGWQWVAGSGADAAPYFRVFNPLLQAQKFDPEGAYIRRWVPELARVPNDLLHEPSAAPPALLVAAGVTLGRDYPAPIVAHAQARARALEAYARVSGSSAGDSKLGGGAKPR